MSSSLSVEPITFGGNRIPSLGESAVISIAEEFCFLFGAGLSGNLSISERPGLNDLFNRLTDQDLKSKSKEELHGILDETALADSKKYYEDIRAVKEQQRDAFEKILDHLNKINAEFDKSDINKSKIKQDLQAIHDKISALDRVIQNIPS